MLTMYPGMVNSPITELAAAIDDVQTTITVVDGTKLPDAPNLAIIGLGEDAETILYTEKTGNVLSGVTRGFQGVAKAWGQGARIARFFTEYDQRAMMQNIQENADNLAAHLNETVHDGVHGLATTKDMTLYVDGTNGDDSNDGLTPQTAFKTIQKAVNSVPKIVNHIVTINVAPGDYSSEDVIIRGFSGGGLLQLLGDTVVSDTRTVDRIYAWRNTLTINVHGFNCLGIGKAGVQASVCIEVTFENIKIDNAGGDGVYVSAGNAIVSNSLISNRNRAMYVRYLGQISSVGNTGTNNNTVFFADAGVIRKGGTQPSGTTQETIINGGQVI